MSGDQQFYQSSFDLFSADATIFADVPITTELAAVGVDEEGLPPGQKTEGYGVYIFTKEIPERQSSRCYYIVYQPSLWDHYTVQRQWGLVGSPNQQFYTEHFRTPRPALARIRRLINRRLRRGYHLSYAA